MPTLRSTRRGRRGWTQSHLMQLASSHDFFCDAWGDLHSMPTDKLAEVVADMQACWTAHEAAVRAECRPREPWFGQYAGQPQKLIDEITNPSSTDAAADET